MGLLTRIRSLAGGSAEERELQAWRERNRDRLLDVTGPTEPGVDRFVEELRGRGIAFGRVEDLFGSRELYDELAAAARELHERHRAGGGEGMEGKGYLASLLPGRLEADDPFARIALHPSVLAVANRYLGMRSLLRSLELWLTRPTPGPATETQLWHRDGDDVMNLKFYVFFTDVTRAAGPFCYAPRTHPLGERRELPERDERGRSTDEQMREIVPENGWRLGTGPSGTVMFADTCGYHKQVKPESDERLMLMVQYTSGTPNYPPAIAITGVEPATLSEDQRRALGA